MSHDRDFIEARFREGMRDADMTTGRGDWVPVPCPYDEHSLSGHWWTRGFSYQARLYRAIEAELALKASALIDIARGEA